MLTSEQNKSRSAYAGEIVVTILPLATFTEKFHIELAETLLTIHKIYLGRRYEVAKHLSKRENNIKN